MAGTARNRAPRDPLLDVAEAAEMLNTQVRFVRRLIAERRIRFVKVGRHVRVPESAITEFVAAGTVRPISTQVRTRWSA